MFERVRRILRLDAGPGLLIVDDDEGVRSFLRVLLESRGVGQIWEAADGEAAIKISYEQSPGLVILDYEMPDMNGEAVARSLQLLNPDVRIILLTAVLHRAPTWADAYLEKADIEQLPDLVDTQLREFARS